MGSSYLDRLNKAQLQAVKHIDGPLLVVAGPGTGKTQLLSARAAHILEQTDTPQSAILCLTFTNKAAINMRERLLGITDGHARDVTVKTFHSFASDIMNMYPDYFWSGARLSTAPDAVQQEIIQDILSSLPLDNPLALKFVGKFTVTGDVLQGLKLAKEAGLTPEKLRPLIEVNLSYIDVIEQKLADITNDRLSIKSLEEFAVKVQGLPSQVIDELTVPLISLSTTIQESLAHAVSLDKELGKTTNTGAWKRKWIQTVDGTRGMATERARNQWWLELANVYSSYRQALHGRGYYDYSDMLVEVLSQLEAHPEMRADIQERYLYVMIDEFQDTNAAQLRLAHLVADHHAAGGSPNLMAVGDDDQSIFKFNGAELNNMLSFRRSYPTCQTVVLTENYRSTQAVLDLASEIIDQAEDRLVRRDASIDKKLHANTNAKNGTIQHISYLTRSEQLSAVARSIAATYSPNSTTAVIARSHESLRMIAGLLLALDVPVHYEQQRNILEHPLVKQVCILAQICDAINDGDLERVNIHIAQTLQHPMWSIDPKVLWQLAVDNFYNPNWLDSLGEHSDEQLQGIAGWLFGLSQAVSDEPLPVCIEYLLGLREVSERPNPIHNYYVKNAERGNEYLHGLSAIQSLRGLATEYSSGQKASLADFVAFIDLETRNGTVINDQSPFVSGVSAVSLLTVHKAKGLEFDSVYIVDAIENNWRPRLGGRKPPANLPLLPTGDDMDDYVRLMFVAATRAKSSLHISSYSSDDAGNDVLPTPLISNVLAPISSKKKIEPVTVLEEALKWPRLETNNELELLRGRLDTYSLSVTHLLNFLDVTSGGPQHFLERNLLRLPEAKSSSLAHGSATHAALEYAQKLINSDEFDLTKVQQAYCKALEREHLPASEALRYRVHGPELLARLFDQSLLTLKAGSAPEQNIKDVLLDKARLQGKLDRIDEDGDQLTVSDYKTGRPLPGFQTKDASLQVRVWKQRTQLIYYALLLQNSSRFKTEGKTLTGQMIYLDALSAKDMYKTYQPTSEEIDRLAKLTGAVWEKIINLDLPDIKKYPQDYSGILQFEEDLLDS